MIDDSSTLVINSLCMPADEFDTYYYEVSRLRGESSVI